MSLRNALRDLHRGQSSTSRSSSTSTSTRTSRSSSGAPPTDEQLVDRCPAYSSDFVTIPTRDTSRSFLEDTLDNDPTTRDCPPPYMLLCNGDKKPDYSSSTLTQAPAELPRMDGALCLRCNMKKAKAWYVRTKEERANQCTNVT